MKRTVLLSIVLLFSTFSFAQSFPVDRWNSSDVTWLGIDFTKARLVNKAAFTNPHDIVQRYLDSWNHIVELEPSKYDLSRFLRKVDIRIDLSKVDEFNMEVDPDNLVQNAPYTVSLDEVIKDAKKYKGAAEGLGVVWYVESFSKPAQAGIYWFLVIDLATGDVIYSEKVSGKPGGFGVRNYWLGAFYNALKATEKSLKKVIR